MKTIRTGNFQVSVPESYEVVEHDHYQEQRAFFENPPAFDDPAVAEFLNQHEPDWEAIRSIPNSFEVKMGRHSLIIVAREHGEPDDLAEAILASTKRTVTLTDVAVGKYRGKTHGQYSDRFTWIDWWVKEANCMITFNLQGRGMPSQKVKKDVEAALGSLEWIAEPQRPAESSSDDDASEGR